MAILSAPQTKARWTFSADSIMAEGGCSQSPEKSSPREEQATPYPQQRAWALSAPGNSLEGKERREGEEKGGWERGRKVEEEGEEKEKQGLRCFHYICFFISFQKRKKPMRERGSSFNCLINIERYP